VSQKLIPVAFDIECYKNYFLAVFASEDGTTYSIKLHNDKLTGSKQVVEAILRKNPLISFNGDNYDLPVLSAFLAGWSNAKLKELSDAIILKNLPRWQLSDHFPSLRIKRVDMGHIDLIGVTPLKSSLKTYGCRIHSKKLQDLPIDPSASISEQDAVVLEDYCKNDVMVTWDIYHTLHGELVLRSDMSKEYGMDLRSKSDPQIAEAIIRHYMEEHGYDVSKRTAAVEPFKYKVPDFIEFETKQLQDVLETVRECTFTVKDTGNVELPDAIKNLVIEFNGAKYKLGIGGLHSQEKRQVIEPNEDLLLGEYDVASMYPSIILGQGLYPEHLGDGFLEVYRMIFDKRMAAKRTGDKTTADTLKIVLNSSYGKFGSKYSFLYSPELLIQTTITGQLALLMLIERLSLVGAQVVSANTDGVVILMYADLEVEVEYRCHEWSKATTYILEWTPYKAMYSESVNSYVALKPDGSAKTKGLYESGSIRKGYSAQVCNDAIVARLTHGTPIDRYIQNATDIRDFLVMRGVRGGGYWNKQNIGKVVRWYYSTEGHPIRYANGNKVAGSDGAVPLMDLTDTIPADLDIQKYIDIAYDKLKRLGL